VIGYGKLGGKELGYASDLDLVFVYDDDPDRRRNYVAAGRRLVQLADHDHLQRRAVRRRPAAAAQRRGRHAGVPIEAFERYQRREGGSGAWTWEHQALTRARFVLPAMPAIGVRASSGCATRCWHAARA
jgi:[glutamine synthetase] adenylyltransferase / [glutamine synthetase]-adenylyl-L-tyrosine phosphorylase